MPDRRRVVAIPGMPRTVMGVPGTDTGVLGHGRATTRAARGEQWRGPNDRVPKSNKDLRNSGSGNMRRSNFSFWDWF